MKPAIKILTIDDQPLFAQGMMACFKKLRVVDKVDTCATYDELLQKLKDDRPHLVFVELNLSRSRCDGFSILREINSRYPTIFVAVLSRYNTAALIKEARACGADAYFDKNTGPEVLHDFLRCFAKGNIPDYYIKVSESCAKQSSFFKQEGFELKQLLTRRERELMHLIVNGNEPEEIQQTLHITYATYWEHHRNLLTKLMVKNDVQLTRFALDNNLTDEDFSVAYKTVPGVIKLR